MIALSIENFFAATGEMINLIYDSIGSAFK